MIRLMQATLLRRPACGAGHGTTARRGALRVAVAAQKLDAVEPIRMPYRVARRRARGDLAGVVEALVGPAGRAIRRQTHGVELDRDVGDVERDGLPVRDRLTESDAFVHVGRHVVEDGLGRSNGERSTRGVPGARTRRRPRIGRAQGAPAPSLTPASLRVPVPAARTPMAGASSKPTPVSFASTMKSAGPRPSRSAAATKARRRRRAGPAT